MSTSQLYRQMESVWQRPPAPRPTTLRLADRYVTQTTQWSCSRQSAPTHCHSDPSYCQTPLFFGSGSHTMPGHTPGQVSTDEIGTHCSHLCMGLTKTNIYPGSNCTLGIMLQFRRPGFHLLPLYRFIGKRRTGSIASAGLSIGTQDSGKKLSKKWREGLVLHTPRNNDVDF
jgi:hypothetical protein